MSFSDPSFVSTPADSFHPIIDGVALARALSDSDALIGDRGHRVMGPFDLHALERARALHGIRGPDAVPTDLFVWGAGEPRHPASTKLGGVPYLPADHAWPEREGTTGDFYGQLNFLDSKDIVPELPGDVLLVFRFHDLDYTSWDESLYCCHWVDVKPQRLVSEDQVRGSKNGDRDPWPTMHAYRMRSYDDPGLVELVRGDPQIPGDLHIAEAAKIGGVASDMQSIEKLDVPEDWRFLGQLIGLFPTGGVPHPLVGYEQPIPEEFEAYHALCSGPGDGITCFFLDAEGDVRVSFSCA